MTVLEEFKKHASAASFHYADDSGKEWGSARKRKDQAMQLYRDNPELRADMREIGKKQLWAYDFKNLAEEIDGQAA